MFKPKSDNIKHRRQCNSQSRTEYEYPLDPLIKENVYHPQHEPALFIREKAAAG